MSVLVTGATTPLGRAICGELVTRGPVLAVGREPSADLPDGVDYASVDLSRARALRTLMSGPVQRRGVHTVVHLAFHRRAGMARSQRLHVDATRLLLRLSEDHGSVRRFVHRSAMDVYATRSDRPDVLREDHPLELAAEASDWIRERVAADLTACTRMGMTDLEVVVLRCSEILAPAMGSQLLDYLRGRVALRPMGFDPVLNLLSLDDAREAFVLAATGRGHGVFNIPGADTLTLTTAIHRAGSRPVGVPGPLIGPAYAVRRRLGSHGFRYRDNAWRFHFNGVPDGTRARQCLGYEPRHPIDWSTL